MSTVLETSSVEKKTDYYAKKCFTFYIEWYIFYNDGSWNDLVLRVLGLSGRGHRGSTKMTHRGRTASGRKVRVIVWRQGAAVGRMIVEPLLLGEEWDGYQRERDQGVNDIPKVSLSE